MHSGVKLREFARRRDKTPRLLRHAPRHGDSMQPFKHNPDAAIDLDNLERPGNRDSGRVNGVVRRKFAFDFVTAKPGLKKFENAIGAVRENFSCESARDQRPNFQVGW